MSVYDDLKFAPVLIIDVFESMNSSLAWYDKSKLDTSGEPSYPFVSRTRASNGIDGFCARQDKAPEPGNAVTIGLDTQTIAYQPVDFYTSQNIQVLRHARLEHYSGLMLIALIKEQMGKFGWGGNGATLGRLAKTRIMVPVASVTESDGEQVVDWDGMTRLGKELFAEVITHTHSARQTDAALNHLPHLRFEPMYVVDVPGRQEGLFRAHKGKRIITAHRKRGTMPFVAGSRVNNSIVDFADLPALFPGGWLTLIYNGDGGTGHAKYQPMPFSASDDVIVLEPLADEATEDALLLMVTLLTHQCVPKFGFGYKLTLHRLGRQKIMVPTMLDASGAQVVDWEGMSRYGAVLRARSERPLSRILGEAA
ncbi:restriction endonuclease subunit S [Microbacterium aurantiacum]|uniref:Restriction endonuclease subunit S n=1 Tax=Microbacterium aurantiacum TaxID=162393 RepID=A0AAJ2HIV8_9MICO|nr:restriction endonuclease subunit S [Microbacterium aurantiacum]MDS0247006.1 restriction endonuclease subunit S [Microbacterium aurantiacum]